MDIYAYKKGDKETKCIFSANDDEEIRAFLDTINYTDYLDINICDSKGLIIDWIKRAPKYLEFGGHKYRV